MLQQLRFRTVVLVVRLTATWRSLTNFSVAAWVKWLRKS